MVQEILLTIEIDDNSTKADELVATLERAKALQAELNHYSNWLERADADIEERYLR